MNWTIDQLKAYTARRLKDEAPARAKMLGARGGYNPAVVTAFFREHGITEPTYEFQFCPDRRFRFDLAWVPQKIYLECDGGLFSGGAHVRGAALLREQEKRNLASSLGWRGVWCTPQTITTKETADLVKLCLGYGAVEPRSTILGQMPEHGIDSSPV